jgi:hypothetical protein
MWSLVNAIGTTSSCFCPRSPRRRITRSVLGPSHLTGPTSDWYANRYGFGRPSRSTTACTLAPIS